MLNDWNEEEIRKLDEEITQFMDRGSDNEDDDTFNELALKVFAVQYEMNAYYREYCRQYGANSESVKIWHEIPALPTKAFRENIIASFPLTETELSLLTSGTTDTQQRGKIYRDKSSLNLILKANFLQSKRYLFPDVDRIRIALLVPSPKAAPGMPMAYGLEQAKQEFGTASSAYYITPEGFQTEQLIAALQESENTDEPICFMGATSGYVYFFNQCRDRGLKFNLPKGSRVFDGGGYQGTFGACSREDFYSLVKEFLNIQEHNCVNILGMGESGTNYFDSILFNNWKNDQITERTKCTPPWAKTVIVGVRTGKPLPKGEIGLIRHYDLTNRATVLGVQTDNLGYETEDGFEIIGRVNPKSAGKGVESYYGIKDWILGTGRPQGMPCSTVADGMMQEHPHGVTCSTVADGMMQGQPHGVTCSTVADGMIQGQPHGVTCSTVADGMMVGAK